MIIDKRLPRLMPHKRRGKMGTCRGRASRGAAKGSRYLSCTSSNVSRSASPSASSCPSSQLIGSPRPDNAPLTKACMSDTPDETVKGRGKRNKRKALMKLPKSSALQGGYPLVSSTLRDCYQERGPPVVICRAWTPYAVNPAHSSTSLPLGVGLLVCLDGESWVLSLESQGSALCRLTLTAGGCRRSAAAKSVSARGRVSMPAVPTRDNGLVDSTNGLLMAR